MATNFRLSYNNGYGYTDLLPLTNIDSIIPNILTSRDYAINIEIPPTDQVIQKITMDIPSKYIGSQAFVELMYRQQSDVYDYATITQVMVVKDGIEITRLYRTPKNAIKAILILNANEKNYLKDNSFEITIPAFTGLVQEIPIAITEAQSVAQFFVELLSKSSEAKFAYSAISQIEVKKDKLVIYRFSEKSNVDIRIKLNFREGGA